MSLESHWETRSEEWEGFQRWALSEKIQLPPTRKYLDNFSLAFSQVMSQKIFNHLFLMKTANSEKWFSKENFKGEGNLSPFRMSFLTSTKREQKTWIKATTSSGREREGSSGFKGLLPFPLWSLITTVKLTVFPLKKLLKHDTVANCIFQNRFLS